MIDDPRPDLKNDTELWQILLTAACFEKDNLLELLKDFRTHGCRLYLDLKQRNLCFNFGNELDEQKKQIVIESAKQYKNKIMSLFRRVYKGLEVVQ